MEYINHITSGMIDKAVFVFLKAYIFVLLALYLIRDCELRPLLFLKSLTDCFEKLLTPLRLLCYLRQSYNFSSMYKAAI